MPDLSELLQQQGGGASAKSAEDYGKEILKFSMNMEARRRQDAAGEGIGGMDPHVKYDDPAGILKGAIEELKAAMSKVPPSTAVGVVSVQTQLDGLGSNLVRDLGGLWKGDFEAVIANFEKGLAAAQQQANEVYLAQLAELDALIDVEDKKCEAAIAVINAQPAPAPADAVGIATRAAAITAADTARDDANKPNQEKRAELDTEMKNVEKQFVALQNIQAGPVNQEMKRIAGSMAKQDNRDKMRMREDPAHLGRFVLAKTQNPSVKDAEQIRKAQDAGIDKAGIQIGGISPRADEIPVTGVYSKDTDKNSKYFQNTLVKWFTSPPKAGEEEGFFLRLMKKSEFKVHWILGEDGKTAQACPIPIVGDYSFGNKDNFDKAWGRTFDMLASKFDKITLDPGPGIESKADVDAAIRNLNRMIELVDKRDRFIKLDGPALAVMSQLSPAEFDKMMAKVEKCNAAWEQRREGVLSPVVAENTAKSEATRDFKGIVEIEVPKEKLEAAILNDHPLDKQMALVEELTAVLDKQAGELQGKFDAKAPTTDKRVNATMEAAKALTAAVDTIKLTNPGLTGVTATALDNASKVGEAAKAIAEKVKDVVADNRSLSRPAPK
jgi:hypothetical protein